MDRNLAVVLTLDTLTIVIGWIIYCGNIPPDTTLFLFASQTILVLGLISLFLTFIYFFIISGVNRYIWLTIIFVIGGTVITFFNWFIGGIVVLIALILLIFSRKKGEKNYLSTLLIFIGFIVLVLLPPIEAMVNFSKYIIDYLLLVISSGLILIGLYLSFKKHFDLTTFLGYLALSLSFFLLPPYHEIFKIKSNGSYGIYDTAIILIATILFGIFFLGIIYGSYKREIIIKKIKEGNSLLKKGKWKKAYATFESIYKDGYVDENVLNGMGVALMHMGKFDESEKYIRQALEIKDKDEYRTNLGNLYYRRGKIDKAMEIYEEILKRNPDCYLALNNMARCLMRKGKISEAEKYLKRAMEVNSKENIVKNNYILLNKYKNEESG